MLDNELTNSAWNAHAECVRSSSRISFAGKRGERGIEPWFLLWCSALRRRQVPSVPVPGVGSAGALSFAGSSPTLAASDSELSSLSAVVEPMPISSALAGAGLNAGVSSAPTEGTSASSL
jgi:hypothetical protein